MSSAKKKKTMRAKQQEPLTRVQIVLPRNLDAEDRILVLSTIRSLSTRCTFTTDGERMKLTAWCTPSQEHRLDRFCRTVLQAKPYDDQGYDMQELRAYFEEQTQGALDDRFILPQDAQRLSLQSAAAGIQTAILDFPWFRRDEDVRVLAAKIGASSCEVWPERTNDVALHQEILVRDFSLGYRLGVQQMQVANPAEQKAASETMLDHQIHGRGHVALYGLSEMLKARMQEVGASSIEELL